MINFVKAIAICAEAQEESISKSDFNTVHTVPELVYALVAISTTSCSGIVNYWSSMTADDVKDALRKRYPGTITKNGWTTPGPFVCIEELWGIDLLAMCCWQSFSREGITSEFRNPWIAHEVKVSRSDMRSELLNPHKRQDAMYQTNQFYFVTPRGLLKDEEIAFEEPEWTIADFQRTPCPDDCEKRKEMKGMVNGKPGRTLKGKKFNADLGSYGEYENCDTCKGKAYIEKSFVEKEWPILWIPKGCGLIEIAGQGCRVIKEAPATEAGVNLSQYGLADFARFVSLHPDPRHDGLIEKMSRQRKNWNSL